MKLGIPDAPDLEWERAQLIATWSSVLRRDWHGGGWGPVHALLHGWKSGPGMALRKLNDKFGWRAAGTVGTRGLCSGAIYRTESFIRIPPLERSGGKKTGNVHIEHTVPIGVLAERWSAYRAASQVDATAAIAWSLVHCVCTAFAAKDRNLLTPWNSKTKCFDPESDWYHLPFKRYGHITGEIGRVYDVFNRRIVDPESSDFAAHADNVFRLMAEAGAPEETLKRVREVAASTDILQHLDGRDLAVS